MLSKLNLIERYFFFTNERDTKKLFDNLTSSCNFLSSFSPHSLKIKLDTQMMKGKFEKTLLK